MNMVETEYRDNTPKKRNLITKGKWPESAGGGKASTKEKIIFGIIVIIVITVLIILIR